MEKRKASRCVLVGGCWSGDAVGGLTRSGVSYVIGWGCVFDFLWLALS